MAGGYALSVDPSAVDALAFEAGQAVAAGLRADGDLAGAARRLHEALGLWQGEPLAGLTGPFAVAQRAQWTERRLGALEARIALDLEVGRHGAVTAELAALAAEFPLRERFRELQMLALSRSGRKAEALAVYDQTRRTLAEELGVDPGPDLRALYRQVAAGGGADVETSAGAPAHRFPPPSRASATAYAARVRRDPSPRHRPAPRSSRPTSPTSPAAPSGNASCST